MSANDKTSPGDMKPSDPISIPSVRSRARSMSVSSASSGSTSSSDLHTPAESASSHRISIPSPSTSPILSHFLAQSPTKTPATATFSFKRKFGTTPVFEAEEEIESEIPVAAHARRASATVANRFSQNPSSTLSEARTDRGTNLLRRLSLSSAAFVKPPFDSGRVTSPPSPPPNTAVSPTAKTTPFSNKPRRSATISSESAKPRRAPSPMGERILKGHFDGFGN
ncbi:hypothetical protein GALMADRAFT_224211 [Galerina marginata CBS 339.88]|uniref:Uncharacterized protein n=1 Tax=Galerina marginata (strain CBS 339.88) TaxID=685588 RepID=A0A067T9F8_GALM3|nr:hypothetical protein GALMADRAFT_224211 [Galerina marginata CBS 339.88]